MPFESNRSIYGTLNNELHWYALTTRNRHEKKVHERLQQKGIISYLPLYTTVRQWSDRKKKVTEVLFSCYVFVRIALKDRIPILQTDGAARLVTFNQKPVPIPEDQIEAIRHLLKEKMPMEIVNNWTKGQHIEVVNGPLVGLKGILEKVKGQSRLVIAIDAIRQAISVDIDSFSIKLID